MSKAIKDVIEAEKKADNIIKKAETSKIKLIEDAKRKSLSIYVDRQEEINKKREDQLDKKREELDKEKEGIIEEGRLKILELEKRSSKNSEKAVTFILEEFENQKQAATS